MDRERILTRLEIEAMVAQGHIIVIFEDIVLRLDSWLKKHPGGHLPILHMVGRDATDEITVSHCADNLKSMRCFQIGRKPPGHWTNLTPPISAASQIPHGLPSIPEKEEESCDPILHEIGLTVDRVSRSGSPDSQLSNRRRGASQDPPHRHHETSEKEKLLSASDPNSAVAQKSGATQSRLDFSDKTMREEIERDMADYPSLDPHVQRDIERKFRELHQKVRDQGFYDCPYIEYGKEMTRYLLLFSGFAGFLCHGWYLTSACFLGLFWHQIMFVAHDAGHRAITHIFVVDTLIAMFVADFCCGLSIGWWKSSHNVHHLITNHPEHDPDIQNIPLFATCPSFFKSLRSTYYDFTFVWDAVADFLVPYQKYTYYPVMGLARFNLYILSWLHLLSSKSASLGGSKAWWIRPTEIAFMCCYWFLFGYCLVWRTLPDWPTRIAFVLVSHVITMPLHVQITLSHWGMSTSDLGGGESFPQRQLRTTMDVDCPAWLDFIHGGLQFQAVHHLFPRVPRHNLRRLQALVKEFCAETGIPYSILGFTDGNKKMLSRLDEVSHQLKIMVQCQDHMAKTGESGLA